MPFKGTSTWEPEHDAELKRLVAAGVTFREASAAMTEKFEQEFTRNACCGRAHRLSIKGDPVVSTSRRTAAALQRKPKTIPARKPSFGESLRALRCTEVTPRLIALLELEPGDCRWPYGDGPFHFCGNPASDGPYCAPHFAQSVRTAEHA